MTSVSLIANDWAPCSPREALMPKMERIAPDILKISATGDFSINGSWQKTFPAVAGKYYRFSAPFRHEQIELPRRSILANIDWQDAEGHSIGRSEFPVTKKTMKDGWSVMEGGYTVPEKATKAVVTLTLRWTATGSVQWRKVSLEEAEAPPPRNVTLASVRYYPAASSGPAENRDNFTPYIEQAGEQGADIVVLPEALTFAGTGMDRYDTAEPVPGPSTEWMGTLARKHGMYIAGGITENEGGVMYNTAVLVDRQGNFVGKYRKMALPREEIMDGTTPGDTYPVFETDFGTVGIMICWDSQFPEVARRLAANGAEIILFPVWGGWEKLFVARAMENQVYLVASGYHVPTAIWNPKGELLAETTENGTVITQTVDLNERFLHWWLGDFKSRIPREAPAASEK